jgi:putative sterol carrier protein
VASLEELTQRVRAAVGEGAGLSRSVKLDLRGEGVIRVEGTSVTNDDAPADLTVSISQADLKAMGERRLDPMTAVIGGRMRLSDMGLAMSLQPEIQALFAKLG